jgi:hypothetical protein
LSSATDASLPELQHNIRLLVEFAEGEIQSVRNACQEAAGRPVLCFFKEKDRAEPLFILLQLEQKLEAERDALAVLENEVCEDAVITITRGKAQPGQLLRLVRVGIICLVSPQCKKVDEQVQKQGQQGGRLEEILGIVERCEARRGAGKPLDIEEATALFRDLQTRFAEVRFLAVSG